MVREICLSGAQIKNSYFLLDGALLELHPRSEKKFGIHNWTKFSPFFEIGFCMWRILFPVEFSHIAIEAIRLRWEQCRDGLGCGAESGIGNGSEGFCEKIKRKVFNEIVD